MRHFQCNVTCVALVQYLCSTYAAPGGALEPMPVQYLAAPVQHLFKHVCAAPARSLPSGLLWERFTGKKVNGVTLAKAGRGMSWVTEIIAIFGNVF